jgi:hypothetical protein
VRKNRYQQPNGTTPEHESFPLDTICTILTRQSTVVQGTRNVFSAEVNPQDLVAVAARLGFASERIRVIDADMGIGAYSTVIEDRPGLHKWLYEDLPQGISRVVLVSQEDRLFRDRDEIEHNRFIAQVAKHGGWVVCGQTVYNFRQEFDRERFRMACKYGKQYIEYHIKGRLHPAIQRAAMAGRYTGGPVPWGYIVDYDQHSSTFKHFLRYPAHADLVVQHVFQVFAGMPHPSTVEVARHWAHEGLVWPYFGPEVDARRVRLVEKMCTRDEVRGGYQFHFRQAHLILTNVAYLGWRVRNGELAREERDGESGSPRICHEPLVEAELFWWCYDHLMAERPVWAPPRRETLSVTSYHPRPLRRRDPTAVLFLAPGRVRCAQHGNPLGARAYPNGSTILSCHGNDRFRLDETACSSFSVEPVNDALSRAFAAQLALDERDIRELARLAAQRERQQASPPAQLLSRIAEERGRLDRAKRLSLRAEDDDLAAEYLEEARQAKQVIRVMEQELHMAQASEAPSTWAWGVAERAATLAERIRTTFPEWPRQAQMRVLVLALQEGVLGHVNRFSFGLWLRWAGGAESRLALPKKGGTFSAWTEAERAALREHFGHLSWDALRGMFPGRTRHAIHREATRLRLHRTRGMAVGEIAPFTFPAPQVTNVMAAYGFTGDEVEEPGTGAVDVTGEEGRVTTAVGDLVSRHQAPGGLAADDLPGHRRGQ